MPKSSLLSGLAFVALVCACTSGEEGSNDEFGTNADFPSDEAGETEPTETETDSNDSSETDSSSTEEGGEACEAGQLDCGSGCVDCPTPSGAAAHTCEAAACVVETCKEDYERCPAGCCAWEFETVDGPPTDGTGFGELALDLEGEPVVAYMDVIDEVRLARRNGGVWTEEVVATGHRCGDRRVVGVDGAGAVHLGLYDWGESRVEYVTDASGAWAETIIDEPGPVQQTGLGLQLVVDADDFVHLAYFETQPLRLLYATNRSGAWVTEVIEEQGSSVISLAVDPEGLPYISHETNGTVHLRWPEGGVWQDELITDEATTNRDLQIDDQGRIHALYEFGYTEVWYAVREGGAWEHHLVDGLNAASRSQLAVDAAGRPHVAYCYNCTEGGAFYHYDDLKYAWFDGQQWRAHVVYDEGFLTAGQIAVDSEGVAQVLMLQLPEINGSTNDDQKTLWWGRLTPAP